MVTCGQVGGDGRHIGKSPQGWGRGDRIAIDVESEAIIRARPEGVAPAGGDFQEAGIGGGAVGGRAREDIGPVADGPIGQAADIIRPREADARHLLGDHRRGGGLQTGEGSVQTATALPETRHVRARENGVLNPERVGATEDDRITRRTTKGRQLGAGADGDQVWEKQGALAHVDGFVATEIEDHHGRSKSRVDLWNRAASGIATHVEEAQDIAIGAGDVQGLPAIQSEVGDGDRVAGVGPVVAHVEIRGSQRTIDDDVVGVSDESVAARAVVLQAQHATRVDGGVGSSKNWGGIRVVQASEGEDPGVHDDTAGEGVVVPQDQGAEAVLGDAVVAAAVADDAVEDGGHLRGFHGDRGVAAEAGGPVESQVGQAAEGQIRAGEDVVIVEGPGGPIRGQEGAPGDGEGTGAERTVGESGDNAQDVACAGGTAGKLDAAVGEGDSPAKGAGTAEAEDAVAGLVDAAIRGHGGHVEGRGELGDGGRTIDRHRGNVKGAGSAEIDVSGDGRHGSGILGSGGDIPAQGQSAGTGVDTRDGGVTVVVDGQSREGLVEVIQVQHAGTVEHGDDAVVNLAVPIEAHGGGVDDEVTSRDGHGGGAVSTRDVQG